MALKTMKDVLIGLSKVMAPFMPFISEQIWQKVSGYNFQNQDKSVHLEKWPDSEDYDQDIIEQMKLARKIVEAGLSKRADAGIKIRQPLPYYSTDLVNTINSEYVDIIKEELNILELRFGDNELGVELSEELLKEGIKRELIRTINSIRKNMGLTINDMVVVSWETDDKLINNTIEEFKSDLSKSVLAKEIKRGVNNIAKEFTINNSIIQIEVNGK
jgi:isoleucyl-tRNA synthetase